MNAQLVLQPDRGRGVSRAVFQDFWHDEERDTLGSVRRTGRARQHQVNDIVGAVVFTPGDVDFLTGDGPGPVRIGFRLGAQRANVRTGLRLGQVHRRRPLTCEQFGQVLVTLLLGPMREQGLDRAIGQHRTQAKGHVRGLDHFQHRHAQRARQAHAADLGRELQPLPAALDELGIGVLETRRRRDDAILQGAAFHIARAIERRQNPAGQLGRLFQNGESQVFREFGKRATGLYRPDGSNFLERETQFIDGCLICHEVLQPAGRT